MLLNGTFKIKTILKRLPSSCVNSKTFKKHPVLSLFGSILCLASSFLFCSGREQTTARSERTSGKPIEGVALCPLSVSIVFLSLAVVSPGLNASRGVLMPAEDEPSHRGDGARAASGFREGGSP